MVQYAQGQAKLRRLGEPFVLDKAPRLHYSDAHPWGQVLLETPLHFFLTEQSHRIIASVIAHFLNILPFLSRKEPLPHPYRSVILGHRHAEGRDGES